MDKVEEQRVECAVVFYKPFKVLIVCLESRECFV